MDLQLTYVDALPHTPKILHLRLGSGATTVCGIDLNTRDVVGSIHGGDEQLTCPECREKAGLDPLASTDYLLTDLIQHTINAIKSLEKRRASAMQNRDVALKKQNIRNATYWDDLIGQINYNIAFNGIQLANYIEESTKDNA